MSIAESDAENVRFLNQATFGANEHELDKLRSNEDSTGDRLAALERWIDDQFAESTSRTLPYTQENSNNSHAYARHQIWWNNATFGADQLRQRVAFALSELFVVSDIDYALSNQQYAITQFYDLLAEHADGNFADLLRIVTLHPVMGTYLGHLRNEPADPARNIRPDENFAREVLQLFTIGLHQLNPDGTWVLDGDEPVPAYTQATVEEFARVFTGWNIAGSRSWDDTNPPNDAYLEPMQAWPEYHDDGAKTLLQGATIPPGLSAEDDLDAALAIIFQHPNVGPFISRFLIQRLVTSNPTPAYIERVAAVFNGRSGSPRGDLGAVVKAILLDAEAREGHHTLPERFGKIKEPILRLTQLWRAFDAIPGREADDGYIRPYAQPVNFLGRVFGQAPLRSPSVFNFFQPDHPLDFDSDLVAPELQLLSEIDVASTNNMLFGAVQTDHVPNPESSDNRAAITKIVIERELDLADDPAMLVEHLNILLTARALPTSFIDSLVKHVSDTPLDADDGLGRRTRCTDAIFAIVASPYGMVQ